MNVYVHPFAVVFLALLAFSELSLADEGCPRTIGANEVFAEPWPQADAWYGAESLAVVLPADGQWTTTRSPALISVKLFWYSIGYQPGMERDFVGRIKRLDDGPNDAEISDATNAGLENGVWTILTGIDFKSAGCWQITGEFQGQSLEFVVETINDDELSDRPEDRER